MIAEGRIVIEIARDGVVQLTSNRGADVSRLLVGREPAEVLALLPKVFSLCGHAHVAAARRAMLGAEQGQTDRTDILLVLAETAREHLLRILTGWRVNGTVAAIPPAPVMALVGDMQAVVGEATAQDVQSAALATLLKDHVLGVDPAEFLTLRTVDDFAGWMAGSDAAAPAYLSVVAERNWQALGAVPVQFLPDLPEAALAARLAEPEFSLRPDWKGHPHETGPLARQSGHPLIAALTDVYGAGLMTRLVARLIELATIPVQITDLQSPIHGTQGQGVVETARGRLIHCARMEASKVASYSILAPTEWNFHPDGVAVQALRSLAPSTDIVAQANKVIEAIDPCVAFEVRAA